MSMYRSLSLSLLALVLTATPLRAQTANNEVTVAVFSLNDFHAGFVQNETQGIPGAPSILQTLDSLKAVYPYHLTVSAGDNFGGSYFYKMTGGQPLPVFFDMAGIRVSALGNHEFDDGQDSLALKWAHTRLRPADWDIKYLCSNVYNAQSAIPAYAQPFSVEHVRLSPTKEVAIGITGLLASSAATQISASRIKGMQFRGDYTAVLDSVRALPDFKAVEQAPIRFLLMHIGVAQGEDGSPVWNDKRSNELSKITGPLYQAFIAGHSHDLVIGRINDDQKPVVQGWWQGRYLGVTKFRVDTVAMCVRSVEQELVSVPLRHPASLTGKALRMQEITDSLLNVTTTDAGVKIGTQIGYCREDLPHDRADKLRLTQMGQLVCESYATAYQLAKAKDVAASNVITDLHNGKKLKQKKSEIPVVVGVSHFGSVRAGLVKGRLTVLDAGEVLPFSNAMCAFAVNGKHLRQLVEFGYHNERFGWMQYARLDVKLNKKRQVKKITYIAPDGTRIRVKDNTPVVIVCDAFMAGGGDDYPVKFFPTEKKLDVTMPGATDCFIQYIRLQREI